MAGRSGDMAAGSGGGYRFPTTQWTVVGAAGRGDTLGGWALEQILRRYLGPLRAHLRQRGIDGERAEDLVQGFVADKVVERELVASAVKEKGKFRTFLLVALDRYVSNRVRDERRLRRSPEGGVVQGLEGAEEGVAAPGPGPSGVFEVAWARQVLAEAAGRMKEECERVGRADVWGVFEGRILGPTLEGGEPIAYEELVVRYGLRDLEAGANLLVTGKRMFARKLRGVVGEYMGEGGDVEEEIRELREALARARE